MEIRTTDIYMNVDSRIVEKGFWSSDITRKKQLVEEAMIEYTKHKMAEYGFNKSMTDGSSVTDLNDLLQCIDGYLQTEEQKRCFFENFIQYILNIAGSFQGKYVVWNIGESLDTITEFDENGQWVSLTTHMETPYITTVLQVIYAYKNKFLEKSVEDLKLESENMGQFKP